MGSWLPVNFECQSMNFECQLLIGLNFFNLLSLHTNHVFMQGSQVWFSFCVTQRDGDKRRGKETASGYLERDVSFFLLLFLTWSLTQLICEIWLVLSFLWASVSLDV